MTACKKGCMMALRDLGGLRRRWILTLIASVLCTACVQSSSRIVIGPNHSVEVFGTKLPGLNGGSHREDHHVSLVVSDVALADDVYNVFSFLTRYGAWEHVRLMLNDDEGIDIYYGTADDYKPLIEYPLNIGVQFRLKDGCKSLTVCCGGMTREYAESKVIEAYNQLGNMGESWSMEVCCSRDYPFCDIIDLCRVAARNGCKLLYFVICQK